MSAIPFAAINAAALVILPNLLAEWFPAGRMRGHEFMVGNLRGDPGVSLRVNRITGKWAEFGDGPPAKGGDIVSLFAAKFANGDQAAAGRELGQKLGVYMNGSSIHMNPAPAKLSRKATGTWQPIVPPPIDVPPPPDSEFAGYDHVYRYHDANGRVLFYIRRRDARPGKRKEFHPLVYGVLGGITGWHAKHAAAPRPLYGLDRLAARPNAPVIVCEGEKAADAGTKLFPGHVFVSGSGGADAVNSTDWLPLKDRRPGIWPDADAAGRKAAAQIMAQLPGAGLVRVDDLPDGADAANINVDDPAHPARRIDVDDVEPWLRDRLLPTKPPLRPEFGRLRLLSVDDAYDAASRDYLLDGLIASGELSVWWGPPKSGKSFLVLRLLYGISLGLGMWEREAVKVPVLYVAAEGSSGIGARIRVLGDTLGWSPDFYYIAQCADLFDPDADLTNLIEGIHHTRARVVALDTLARTMGNGNENATQDMNVYVANCDRIREETGAHVLIVHHGTWDGSHARGSTALIGACDLVVKITGKRDEPHSMQVEYAKDDPEGDVMGFSLSIFELPPDAKGRPRRTCLAVEADSSPANTKSGREAKLADKPALLLRAIRNLDPKLLEERRPEPEMPLCKVVTRANLRAILIEQGWFPESMVVCTGPLTAKLIQPGPSFENNHLSALKRKNILNFNRRDIWLL